RVAATALPVDSLPSPPGIIAGIITDASGHPQKGSVTLESEGIVKSAYRTDGGGRFSVSAHAVGKEVRLRANRRDESGLETPGQETNLVLQAGVQRINLTAPAAFTVKGTIVDQKGRRVFPAKVSLRRQGAT